MMILKVKLMADKFHKEYEKQKARAVAEHNTNKQKLFVAKGRGQWYLCKELGAKRTSPLIVVKRPCQGRQNRQREPWRQTQTK